MLSLQSSQNGGRPRAVPRGAAQTAVVEGCGEHGASFMEESLERLLLGVALALNLQGETEVCLSLLPDQICSLVGKAELVKAQ